MAGPTTAEVNASSGCKPGVTTLLNEIQAKWPGTTSAGCYNRRTVAGSSYWSYHAAGRAIDVSNTPAIMQEIATYVAGKEGIEEVIYNRKIWESDQSGAGWRNYNGPNPHTDHVHIGASINFSGQLGGNPNINLAPITIQPIDNIKNLIGDFPDPNCTYTFGKTKDGIVVGQKTGAYYKDITKKTLQSPCSNDEDLKIFPGFQSDCWDSYYLPDLEYAKDNTCFCQPLEVNQHCCKWRNDSVYDSRGEFILKIGNKDLKNFRFSMWIEASDDLDLPCDNLKFWINRERQFAVEIPHFPKGSVYKNTATNHTITFANKKSEPAIKYVTGRHGGPLGDFSVPSCYTAYTLVEFDCHNTADNAEFCLGFSYRYLSSGTV